MKFIFTATLSSFLLISGVSTQAFAKQDSVDEIDGWTAKTINLSWHGSGVQKKMRGVIQPAEGVYSGTAQTAGNVAFTCYSGNFSVNVALKPIDLGILFTDTPDSTRRKVKRADIQIDGEKIKSSDWIYMPAIKVYRARKRSTAAKLYNSVIRQSDVLMKSNRSQYIKLNLPKSDLAFKNFGAECGIGALANKKP